MDPSFWQIPDEPPPPYNEEEERLALEAPQGEGDEDNQQQFGLPNYDDVEKRLAQPEMNYERRQNYLKKSIRMQKRDENK